MSAPVSLQTAIANRGSTDFSNLGKGSLFSWKVEVLLYDPNTGWKFEKANTFQRVFWKIAKYVPFLKQYHNTVDMSVISDQLGKITSPSPGLQELISRVNVLRGQSNSITLQDDLNKNGGQWFLPSKKTDINIEGINPNELHGEVAEVAEHLHLEETSHDLALISYGEDYSPDVLYRTPNGKIRIYEGSIALNSQHRVYREYNSIDEAVADFKQKKDLVSHCASSLRKLLDLRVGCSRGLFYMTRYDVDNLHKSAQAKGIDPQVKNALDAVNNILNDPNLISDEDPPKALIDTLKPIVESAIQCLLEKMHATYEPKAKNPLRV